MKKIAFCFLIYDRMNHEELWRIFFSNIDRRKYTIYIHYKENKPLKYFNHYKLKKCIETRYENHTIPLAYNLLFREAFKNLDNYKFLILSGSCIPMKSFNHIYDKLIKDKFGYFNTNNKSECFPNCRHLRGVIEEKFISKSHDWFIMNRKLVKNLCFDKDEFLNKHYNKIYAPAEYFYYTFIKLLKLEKEIITTHMASDKATTFTNWWKTDYKYVNPNGIIKYYGSISKEELLYLLNGQCLFGRKFKEECTVNGTRFLDFQPYMNTITSYSVKFNLK